MPPRSPLPQRHGLDAAWVRTPDNVPDAAPPWATMGAFLRGRLAADAPVEAMLAAGEFVDAAGDPLTGAETYRPHTLIWFHRPWTPEPVVPFPVTVLHIDERIVVVDKPHFLATTPRGVHARETVLARLRVELDAPELAPAHRLDRLTAGVLVLTRGRAHRAAYAGLFQERRAEKGYEALAPVVPGLAFPRRVINRIEKPRGSLQARVVPGEPNAETLIELVEAQGGYARYRLTPVTGKTHQLRVHLAGLGAPIVGDPLYPRVLDVAPDDFSTPLQLVARSLRFTDPVDGTPRVYTSAVPLDWPAQVRQSPP